MKRLVVLGGVIALLCQSALAQNASSAWRDVLKRCAQTDVIGAQSLFFGVSNTIGPGSVWRYANDGSIRLLFALDDMFPNATDQAGIVHKNNIAACNGTATVGWNLRLGLPFSTSVTPLSGDVAATLRNARTVTVSVSGWAVDDLKETNWKAAANALPHTNRYVMELEQPNRIIAENVVKVTGLKATFTFRKSLSAQIQALFTGKTFSLGKSASSAPAGSTPSPAPGATQTSTAASASALTGCSQNNPSVPTANSDTAAGSAPGPATIRAEITRDNEITLCADGPFYILGAYSKIVNSEPTGVAPGAEPERHLVPFALPKHAKIKDARKATP